MLAKLSHLGFDDNKTYLCANLLNRSKKSSHGLWKKKKVKLAKKKLMWKIKVIQVKYIEDWRPSFYVIKESCKYNMLYSKNL